MIKKYLIIILLLFFVNVFSAFAEENVQCTYYKGDIKDYYCVFTGWEEEEKVMVEIQLNTNQELRSTIKNRPVVYYNNTKTDSTWLDDGSGAISAVTYYQNNKTCPPYLLLYEEFNQYNAHFVSEKKFATANGNLGCVLPLVKLQYDDSLEKKEEIYSCNLYSSNYKYLNESVGVTINYTKKTIDFSVNETREDWKTAMSKYKDNFDFTKKNVCPVNQLKLCEIHGYYHLLPDDYEIDASCKTLDSTQKLLTGDTYCGPFKTFLENDDLIGLKNYCNIVLSNQNYDSDISSCINMCLNKEKYVDYEFNSSKGECGFSERLLSFFANILRWIKYLLPVAVIVLGILDFIKAMGADKEDEMKKAQGRFVKRLIAAALLFIVPLIIEFILDKIGFGYDSCGLF